MPSGISYMIQAEVPAEKHARYKVAAMQEQVPLKKFIVKALDEYMDKYYPTLLVINLEINK